jgi:hypothetical protein
VPAGGVYKECGGEERVLSHARGGDEVYGGGVLEGGQGGDGAVHLAR